jgi:hypothetical protein
MTPASTLPTAYYSLVIRTKPGQMSLKKDILRPFAMRPNSWMKNGLVPSLKQTT